MSVAKDDIADQVLFVACPAVTCVLTWRRQGAIALQREVLVWRLLATCIWCVPAVTLVAALHGTLWGGAAALGGSAALLAAAWLMAVVTRMCLAEHTAVEAIPMAPFVRYMRLSSVALLLSALLVAWGALLAAVPGASPLLLPCRVGSELETCVRADRAVPALACALAAALVWADLLRRRLATSLALSPLEPLSWHALLWPSQAAASLAVALLAALLAHFAVPLAAIAHTLPSPAPALWPTLRAASLTAFVCYGAARVTRALHSATLTALPAAPVLLRVLLPPAASPLVALPLLRGLHRAAAMAADGLYVGLLDRRIRVANANALATSSNSSATLWSFILDHAVQTLADKEALALHWARGVAPVPAARGLRAWLMRAADPRAGLADLPTTLLWIRTVTLLVEQSLRRDTSGAFTAQRSFERWLQAVCGLYAALQSHVGHARPLLQPPPAALQPRGATPLRDGGVGPIGRAAASLMAASAATASADAVRLVPLAPRLAASRVTAVNAAALPEPAQQLRDECRVCAYRLVTVFAPYMSDVRFDPRLAPVIESFRNHLE